MAKIMVVDDEADVRLALSLTLEDSGYEISTAEDGVEALEAIRAQLPDLVLLDINMPAMDGFQVLEQLKMYRETSGIPVVMISARSRPRDREDALFMGAADYITKPWSEGELELRVSWALASGASRLNGAMAQTGTQQLSTAVA